MKLGGGGGGGGGEQLQRRMVYLADLGGACECGIYARRALSRAHKFRQRHLQDDQNDQSSFRLGVALDRIGRRRR